MTKSQTLPLAIASLQSSITWNWQLKLDENSLYRWYLDGTTPTTLRGTTRTQAESALRRFVEHSLRGDLKIVSPPERIAADSEAQPVASGLEETG
jgi:hypothetical protein